MSQARVLVIFKTAVDIFKTGFQIVNLIKKQNSVSNEEIKADIEEARRSIETLLLSSTTVIIREIRLQFKLYDIESTEEELNSLMYDLNNYILAHNEIDRIEFKRLFLDRFHQSIANIRKLPRLLSYTIPGLTEPLVNLICDASKCNMTAIHEFQRFYAYLLSKGSTLWFVFRELSNMTSDDVEQFWNASLPQVQEQFDNMETTCKERFPDNAMEDIKENIDASTMYDNCRMRYTWAWCDVLYYPPMGTYQFHYHTSVADFVFWNEGSSSGRNQIMVLGDYDENVTTWDPREMNDMLALNNDTFRAAIDGSEDSIAAKNVGNAVEDFVKKNGSLLNAFIVYFDADDLGNVSRKLDNDSMVAYLSIDKVTLKYCYNTGAACWFARSDLLNKINEDWKELTGTFHVYVYPCPSSDQPTSCDKHKTGAAMGIANSFWTIGLSSIFIVSSILWVQY